MELFFHAEINAKPCQLRGAKNRIQPNNYTHHYSYVTWVSWHVKSLVTLLFVHPFVQTYLKEKKSILCITDPLWREPTGFPHNGPVMWELFPCHDVHTLLCFLYQPLLPISLRKNWCIHNKTKHNNAMGFLTMWKTTKWMKSIESSHKSHNALDKQPTMQHMCTFLL